MKICLIIKDDLFSKTLHELAVLPKCNLPNSDDLHDLLVSLHLLTATCKRTIANHSSNFVKESFHKCLTVDYYEGLMLTNFSQHFQLYRVRFHLKQEETCAELAKIKGVRQVNVLGLILYLLYICDISNSENTAISTLVNETSNLVIIENSLNNYEDLPTI